MNYKNNYKKIFLILTFFLVTIFFSLGINKVNAGSTDLTGWGWSSNIGYISFNCLNMNTCGTVSYKVTVSTTSPTSGTFSGYAWSSNIGWIKFAGDGGTHTGPAVDLGTGNVTGWIRACSGTVNKDCISVDRTDGWDGWIMLSDQAPSSFYPTGNTSGTGGITYDPVDGYFKGYAWGGVNTGWMTFSPSLVAGLPSILKTIDTRICCGSPTPSLPTVSLSADPTSVNLNESSTLRWTVSNATSCTAGGGWSGPKSISGDSESTGNLSEPFPKNYTITCSNLNGSATASAQVTLKSPSDPGVKMWLKPKSGVDNKNLSSIKIKVGDVVNLAWIGENITFDNGACVRILKTGSVDKTLSSVTTSYDTISGLAKGIHYYIMSCKNTTPGPDFDKTFNALAPNNKSELTIFVFESKIEEI